MFVYYLWWWTRDLVKMFYKRQKTVYNSIRSHKRLCGKTHNMFLFRFSFVELRFHQPSITTIICILIVYSTYIYVFMYTEWSCKSASDQVVHQNLPVHNIMCGCIQNDSPNDEHVSSPTYHLIIVIRPQFIIRISILGTSIYTRGPYYFERIKFVIPLKGWCQLFFQIRIILFFDNNGFGRCKVHGFRVLWNFSH